METLNAGMYVRTKFGISKIIEDGNVKVIKSDNEETYDVDKNGRHYPTQFRDYIWTSDVIKASHNIIDLIEVGDVIEVKEFKGKYEVRQFGLELSIVKEDTIYNLNSLLCTLNIKTIVTKEQFESMSYKVGE